MIEGRVNDMWRLFYDTYLVYIIPTFLNQSREETLSLNLRNERHMPLYREYVDHMLAGCPRLRFPELT